MNSRKKAILACTYFGAAICYFDFVAPNSCKDQNKTPNPAVSCLSFFVSHKIILIESHDLILQQFSSLKSPKLFSYCLYRSHSVFLIIHYRPYIHFLLFCLTFFCFFRWQHKGAWKRQNRSRIALETALQSQLKVLMSVCWTSEGQRCYWTKQSFYSRQSWTTAQEIPDFRKLCTQSINSPQSLNLFSSCNSRKCMEKLLLIL